MVSREEPALVTQVNCLSRTVTDWLKEWIHEERSNIQESLVIEDHSLSTTAKTVWEFLLRCPLSSAKRTSALDSEDVDALVDSFKPQFQPRDDPLVSEDNKMVTEAKR